MRLAWLAGSPVRVRQEGDPELVPTLAPASEDLNADAVPWLSGH